MCMCTGVCMCACACEYRYVCVQVRAHVYVCMHMCVQVYMCRCVHPCAGMCRHVYVCAHVHSCAGMGRCMCAGVCMHVHVCAGVCMLVPRDPSATVGLGRTCGVSPALWTGRAPCGRQPPPARPPLPVLLTPSLFPHFLLSSAVHCESSPKSLDMVLLSGAGLQIFSRSPRIVLSSTQSRKGRGVRLILRVCC